MRIRNKKGGFPLEIIVTIGVFILLLWTYGMLSTKYESFNKKIGEKQLDLFTTYGKGEKTLLYVDMSASLSSKQALYDLGLWGGVSGDCEQYLGYLIWDKDNPQCYPTESSATTNFKEWFIHHLNGHFESYNNAFAYIPLSNYPTLSISPSFIVGIASEKIEFSTITEKEIIADATYENQQALIEKQYATAPTTATINAPTTQKGFVKITGISCSGSCVLEKAAFEKLMGANDQAKKQGFEIHVYSSYRSMEQQIALWEGKTPERYAQRYPDPVERNKYVANPYAPDAAQRNTHLLGKAVDVRIKDKTNAQMTPSDWRRLEDALYKAGWVRYANEVWHFEFDTDRWTRAKAEEKKTGKEVRALV